MATVRCGETHGADAARSVAAVDPSGDVAGRTPDGGASVEPHVWKPFCPVPLRDTVRVGEDDEVDVGGAVEGGRLDHERASERRAEALRSGDGDPALGAQIDGDHLGATVVSNADR